MEEYIYNNRQKQKGINIQRGLHGDRHIWEKTYEKG